MSLWQQIVQLAQNLSHAFDQTIMGIPVIGTLFSPNWNVILGNFEDGFALLTTEGSRQIPHQIDPKSLSGRNCLRLGAGLGQIRRLRLPEAAASDPGAAIALSLETLSPIAPEDIAFAVQTVDPLPGTQQIEVQVALASKTKMTELQMQAHAIGLRVDAVDVSTLKGSLQGPVIDLLSGQSARTGVRPAHFLAGFCLLILGAAFSLNLWADWKLEPQAAQLSRSAQPAGFALAKVQRVDWRSRMSVMEIWKEITQALPDSAWADTLTIDGNTLHLAGHADNAAALVSALDASPALTEVRLAAASVQEENGQESFDLQATITARSVTP